MSGSFAAVQTKYGVVVLDDALRWQSEEPGLASLAEMHAPASAIGPGDGDPQAALLSRLQSRLGGERVCRQDWKTVGEAEFADPAVIP